MTRWQHYRARPAVVETNAIYELVQQFCGSVLLRTSREIWSTWYLYIHGSTTVHFNSPGVLHGKEALHGIIALFRIGSDSLDDLIEDIFGERGSGGRVRENC